MNIWAKLSLACIAVTLFATWYETTVDVNDLASPVWGIVFFIPFVGVVFAFGAKKPVQIAWLRLLNLSCYPLGMVYALTFIKPMMYR
jgi:uncharacterized membrane protein YqaE (UPF0057 family)